MNQRRRTIVTGILAIALVASLLGVIAVAVNPPPATESYTEFYVLGPSGNATNYPNNLSVGETGHVIVGVSNHEHRTMTYTVVGTFNNRTVTERTIQVANEETWHGNVTFTAREAGRQQLQLRLYQSEAANASAAPYRYLRIWVNVTK